MRKIYFTEEARKAAISGDKKRYAEKEENRVKKNAKQAAVRESYSDEKRELEKAKSRERTRLARLRDIETARARDRAYYAANREKEITESIAWALANPEKKRATRRIWHSKRYLNDINYRLTIGLRNRTRTALRGIAASSSFLRDLGCSLDEFRTYIEAKFQPGMTWENWGRGIGKWNLDHIYPLSRADLSDREVFLAVAHYTNYQPLWWIDNIRKGAKVTPE